MAMDIKEIEKLIKEETNAQTLAKID